MSYQCTFVAKKIGASIEEGLFAQIKIQKAAGNIQSRNIWKSLSVSFGEKSQNDKLFFIARIAHQFL